MTKFRWAMETLYICIALMFFSREMINSGESKHKGDFNNCGVSV
jgi:hypothetical protein